MNKDVVPYLYGYHSRPHVPEVPHLGVPAQVHNMTDVTRGHGKIVSTVHNVISTAGF